MATITNGIMGSFSGKVGTVVGYTRYGRSYMRSLPKKFSKEPSEAQLENRRAMSSVMAWLKPIKAYVRLGFKNYSDKQHGFGSAVSYIKTHALREDKTLDPSLALISIGDLPEPMKASVSNSKRGILKFEWTAVKDNTDRAMVLAYTDATNFYGDLGGARRKEGKHFLPCASLIGRDAEIYLAFVSEERDQCSRSVYLGRIRVK